DAVEHVKDVGTELDTVADGAERRRPFEHTRGDAVTRERQRRGEAAKPAADDEDGLVLQGQSSSGGRTPAVEPPNRRQPTCPDSAAGLLERQGAGDAGGDR